MAYTRAWDETAPLGSAQASTLDDILRNLKVDLRERFNVLFTDFTTDPVVANANISDAGTTTVISCLRLTRTTTGTAAAGLGGRALFQLEDASGNTDAAAAIDILWTDATHASEDADFVVRLMDAGSAHAEKFRVNSDGNISFTGTQVVFQSGGITGTVTWAPATSNKTITLPNGTTDFTATGGTGQFVKQASAGAAFTVSTVAASEIASGAALTKTDDTNVTLTLGGSPTTSLLAAASLTLGWTGTLAVARGGTGGSAASITLFNNITGYTAAGATGTTSTNLVFSTSPTLVTPVLGVATGSALTLNSSATTNPLAVTSGDNTDSASISLTQSGTKNCAIIQVCQLTTGIISNWGSYGKDSAGNTQLYGLLETTITDATSGSEDAFFSIDVAVAGTVREVMRIDSGDRCTVGYLSLTAGSNQITLQSAGVQGIITATPTTATKTWTFPDATGTVAVSATSPITLSAAGAIGITQTSITSLGTITTGVWNGTAVTVPYGGTGLASTTAYAVLCGGTTSTAAFQSIAGVGTSGQVLTSNGAGALPTFQAGGMDILQMQVFL